jgi:hypothetical protein
MKRLFLLSIILPFFATSQESTGPTSSTRTFSEDEINKSFKNPFVTIGKIPTPEGYERVQALESSFARYLRELPLKKDRTVYLFNGQPKINQDAQFAVINISVGKKDLQQCADAVMRLRAEYLYANREYEQIRFADNAKVVYVYRSGESRNEFDLYLEKVFSFCGTLSLEKQLQKRKRMDEVNIGDVLIKGGTPGHAMLVVDMAVNKAGKKIILLSQSYMPAQDIHLVMNPEYPKISPWYIVDNEADIITPEWVFKPSQLRYW